MKHLRHFGSHTSFPRSNKFVSAASASIAVLIICSTLTLAQKPAASRQKSVDDSTQTNKSQPEQKSPGAATLREYLATGQLTLEQAITLAMVHNRTLASSVSSLLKSQGKVAEARAALNPTLGLDAALTEFDAATTVSFAGTNITTLNQFNPVFTTAASMPIDIMGELRAAISQNQFEQAASRIEINRVKNALVFEIKSDFIAVLRGQAQLNVAQDTLNNALLRRDTAQKSFDAGTAPRFDIIRADTDVANAQQNIIQARTTVKLALAMLKNAIGIDISLDINLASDQAIVLPSSIEAPPSPLAPPPPVKRRLPGEPVEVSSLAPKTVNDPLALGPEYTQAVAEAIKTRPEILEAEAHLAAAERGIRLAKRSRDPHVSLNLGYTLTPNNTVFSRENVFAGTVDINIPLYDGGVARARVEQAKADVGSAVTARREAEDGVTLDVQQAYLALIQAREKIAVAEVGLKQAKEAARLSRVRYAAGVSQQIGVSPLLELSDSENSLTNAEFNSVNALYDYNTARAQLDHARGRFSYLGAGPGYHSLSDAKKASGEHK